MRGHLRADRAEQQPGEPAEPSAAHHDEIGPAGLLDHCGARTAGDLAHLDVQAGPAAAQVGRRALQHLLRVLGGRRHPQVVRVERHAVAERVQVAVHQEQRPGPEQGGAGRVLGGDEAGRRSVHTHHDGSVHRDSLGWSGHCRPRPRPRRTRRPVRRPPAGPDGTRGGPEVPHCHSRAYPRPMTSDVQLRPVREDDLVEFFLHQQDPEANRMAAFGPKDPADHREFARHWARVLTNPANLVRTVEVDGEVVGYVSAFPVDETTEVSYWIDPARWGRGHATAGAGRPAARAAPAGARPRRQGQRRLPRGAAQVRVRRGRRGLGVRQRARRRGRGMAAGAARRCP